MPGEPEARTRAQREADGVPLQADTWVNLAAGRAVGCRRRAEGGAGGVAQRAVMALRTVSGSATRRMFSMPSPVPCTAMSP